MSKTIRPVVKKVCVFKNFTYFGKPFEEVHFRQFDLFQKRLVFFFTSLLYKAFNKTLYCKNFKVIDNYYNQNFDFLKNIFQNKRGKKNMFSKHFSHSHALL